MNGLLSLLFLAALYSFSPTSSIADEEPLFGTYGYKHGLLHEHGVIPDLLNKTGLNCCDGGMGGECRATRLRSMAHESGNMTRMQWEFLHHETWCPVNTEVRFDVIFPYDVISQDITAVVCARKAAPGTCPPTTFCAAQAGIPG